MKNSKTPRSKKIEKNRSLGTGGRGRLSKCKALFFKGEGAHGRILRKKYKRIGKPVTFQNRQFQHTKERCNSVREINTTSNQLLAIERSFDFEVENSPVEKKPPSDGSDLL